jgi:hypothetical protein
VLLPAGANASNVSVPDAMLQKNCSLMSYDRTGKVVYATRIPSPAPVGPCRLMLAPNGTLYITDLGNGNATVWSNELLANRTSLTGNASCTPYSLAVLTTGTLVERDCANRTVWFAPPVAGGAHLIAFHSRQCQWGTPLPAQRLQLMCDTGVTDWLLTHSLPSVLQWWDLCPGPAPTAPHPSA